MLALSPLPYFCLFRPFFRHFVETRFCLEEAEEEKTQPQSCGMLIDGQKMPVVGLG